jgi:hypothetical protein
MAFLELFVGGKARFVTYDLPPSLPPSPPSPPTLIGAAPLNSTVALIESVKADAYYLLVSALSSKRSAPFTTTVTVSTDAKILAGGEITVEQYRMNSSRSVVETIVRELQGKPGMLIHNDGMAYDFGRLLTPAGLRYAQEPANLERYWALHAGTFKPEPFEGKVVHDSDGTATFEIPVTAASTTVLVARSK